MASLTPGVLLKLLQSMNTEARVAGEHRSAVLQVIGIVPALSGADLWPCHGFYVQISDSANSTYVSLSDHDSDVILSNRAQIGQFVYLERLHFEGSPVPRAYGVRPIHGRPHPFIGKPEPLVVQVSPNRDGFLIQPTSSADPPPPPPISPPPKVLSSYSENRAVLSARENLVPGKTTAATKRRFSSPASVKSSRKSVGAAPGRDPSPANRGNSRAPSPASGRANSRASSPVPTKAEVPSLMAAKEENRRVSREPGIIVPSRYRQPSPSGGRRAASPMSRRNSMSPGRRLSGVLKLSPVVAEGGNKKKFSAIAAGISKASEALMMSMRASRKNWDDSSSNASEPEKTGSKNKLEKPANQRSQIAMSNPMPNVSGEQQSEEEQSPVQAVPKITVHERKWTDGSIPLDALPEKLMNLGKNAFQRRSVCLTAAAEAMEEALATESILRSLSMFSDLRSSSRAENPIPAVDWFLTIYGDVVKWTAVAESLANSRSRDAMSVDRYNSIQLWIDAALTTDIEVVSTLTKSSDRILNSWKAPKSTLPMKNGKVQRAGMIETLELVNALRGEMQIWFLGFVEEAVAAGFQLGGDRVAPPSRDNARIAAVLSNLKRVNGWLDGVGQTQNESLRVGVDQLKRKLYGFVLQHVESTFDSSVSISV